jgi:hypothetical protein
MRAAVQSQRGIDLESSLNSNSVKYKPKMAKKPVLQAAVYAQVCFTKGGVRKDITEEPARRYSTPVPPSASTGPLKSTDLSPPHEKRTLAKFTKKAGPYGAI